MWVHRWFEITNMTLLTNSKLFSWTLLKVNSPLIIPTISYHPPPYLPSWPSFPSHPSHPSHPPHQTHLPVWKSTIMIDCLPLIDFLSSLLILWVRESSWCIITSYTICIQCKYMHAGNWQIFASLMVICMRINNCWISIVSEDVIKAYCIMTHEEEIMFY